MFDHLEPFVNGLDALESVFQKVGFITYAGLVITKIFKFLFGGLRGSCGFKNISPKLHTYFMRIMF